VSWVTHPNSVNHSAFASTHKILGTDGAFVSLLDSPEALATACANRGT
jgi:hypothetical protein